MPNINSILSPTHRTALIAGLLGGGFATTLLYYTQWPSAPTKRSILIINPNTTQSMTDALKPVVQSLGYTNTTYTFFTAPSGVASINTEHDAEVSTQACLPALRSLLDSHDAFLICCYSAHPLVPALRTELAQRETKRRTKPVTGIFEASVAACLQLLTFAAEHKKPRGRFAILTTGPQYEVLLNSAVQALLVGGGEGEESTPSARFVGTLTTGLNADQLHSSSREDVQRRMKDAAREALGRGARALCLGCAGMVGLETAVREACIETLGEVEGRGVWIVDGVVSGVTFLEGVLRAGG